MDAKRLRGDKTEVFKNSEWLGGIDRNLFSKLKKNSITRGHKAALVKVQCRLDMRNYSFSQFLTNMII